MARILKQFTPDYWHAKAEEARAQAKEMRDPDTRSTMLQLAKIYNAMALRMEERLAETKTAA
jgi:hypothetical protein